MQKIKQLQIFIVEPENRPTRVKVRPSRFTNAHGKFTILMTQFPVNLNNATPGQKLQGMSLDALIIPAFPSKTLSALFKTGNTWCCRVSDLCQNSIFLTKLMKMNRSNQPKILLNFFKERKKWTH